MNKRTFAVVALLLAAGLAQAQVDDRARELLEGMNPGRGAGEVTTLDQTMTMTLYNDGDELVTTMRMVIDFPGKRAAAVSEIEGMATTMVHQDGATVMKIDGMSLPVPPGMDSLFDGAFDHDGLANLLDDPDAVATYDGVVSYADVLAGHQVTYTGDFGVPGAGIDASTIRWVFDDSGRLIGQVVPAEGTDLVYVFTGEPKVEGGLFYDADIYEVSGGAATPFGSVRYESVTINEPIDESLFR
ncbi:MAG TPA: hypothetical protein VF202_09840 [Trueperaceae bacterium]|jgi:hypothetical protein